jgi:hypothetical protein
MWVPKKLRDIPDLSPSAVLVYAFGTIIAVAVLLDRIEKLRRFLQEALLAGISPHYSNQQLGNWLFASITTLALLVIALALLYWQAEWKRSIAAKNLDERKTKAYRTLQGMMRAAQRIRTQSYPEMRARKAFKKIDLKYLIKKDFTAEVTRTYTLRAVDQELHFWLESYQVLDVADSAEYLVDIDFKVEALTIGTEVVYLPTQMDGKSKAVSIYFLPFIETGQERVIRVSYTWPRLAKSLQLFGEEAFSFNYDSAEPVDEVVFEMYIEPGTGGALKAEIAGQRYETCQITHKNDLATGWQGFSYSVQNSPAGAKIRHSVLTKWRRP